MFSGVLEASLLLPLTDHDRRQGFIGSALFYGFGEDGQGNSDAVLSGQLPCSSAAGRKLRTIFPKKFMYFKIDARFQILYTTVWYECKIKHTQSVFPKSDLYQLCTFYKHQFSAQRCDGQQLQRWCRLFKLYRTGAFACPGYSHGNGAAWLPAC